MELDSATGLIRKTDALYSAAHLPPGIPVRHGTADRGLLNEWWTDRSIPASRSGIREALETMGLSNTGALLVRCYGLSLSDQYWICPEDSGLTWDRINFFDHDFSCIHIQHNPFGFVCFLLFNSKMYLISKLSK